MARPKKKTVDYFPHNTSHDKTIFILESRWGNDGYAFWFKLLEILGDSIGLFYYCRNPADWEFLLAKTRVNDDTAREILDCLASLGAIDSEFWGDQVLYSQDFVDSVSDAFKRRTEHLPSRERVSAYINPVQQEITQTFTGKEKVKEKVKEKKKKEEKNAVSPPTQAQKNDYVFSCSYFQVTQDFEEELKVEHPLLHFPDLYRGLKEYIDDNPERYKRNSTGRLVASKRVLRSWCSREKLPVSRGQPGNVSSNLSRRAQELENIANWGLEGDGDEQTNFQPGDGSTSGFLPVFENRV